MEVVVANFDDWQGIYVDGKLKYENHSLHYRDILEAIGQDFENLQVDMMELDLGRLPETVEELKRLIGENK